MVRFGVWYLYTTDKPYLFIIINCVQSIIKKNEKCDSVTKSLIARDVHETYKAETRASGDETEARASEARLRCVHRNIMINFRFAPDNNTSLKFKPFYCDNLAGFQTKKVS